MRVDQVKTDKAPAAIGPYSQAVVAGGFLFSAGQIALDPASGQIVDGGVTAQTDRVMQNLKAVLDQAGLTWTDVVKTISPQSMRSTEKRSAAPVLRARPFR